MRLATSDAEATTMTQPPAHPPILYGTAWKEERTRALVLQALEAGYRGIDTANQRKHYHEAGVGEALEEAFARGLVSRDDLFLQTKFTFIAGQDRRLPYDRSAPIAQQVAQSFSSSLDHLAVDSLDSLVLHGPTLRMGLHDDDLEAWGAMEAIHASGGTRFLGVSNISLDQLTALCAGARVAPSFVQNRCFASSGWDRAVRAFCSQRGIRYQGFSLLTANPGVVSHRAVAEMARRHECTPPEVVFAFARQIGMLPLTGTTDPEHVRDDLASLGVQLLPNEIEIVERLGLA